MINKNTFAPTATDGVEQLGLLRRSSNGRGSFEKYGLYGRTFEKYGWEYIVCDIQWYEPTADSSHYHQFADLCMDEYGRVIPAPNRFPSASDGKGFGPIAEYIHNKGLKFGIHIMRGIPRQAVTQKCKKSKERSTQQGR